MDVSIIVPVYNAEKTIERCLDSILKQITTFKYEIIVIDDGSKDNSLKKIEEYKRFVKIIKETNGGPGKARNIGIKEAKANFLLFVDSDDYVANNFVDTFLKVQKKTNADMVICNFIRDIKGTLVKENKGEYKEYTKDFNDILMMEFHSCNKLIRKSVALNNLYPENMVFEDVVAISNMIVECKKIVKIENYLYYYVTTPFSITRELNENKLENHIKAYTLMKDKLLKYGYKDFYEYIGIEIYLIDVFIKYIKMNKLEKAKKIRQEFISLNKNWYSNKYIQTMSLKKRIFLYFIKRNWLFLINLIFNKRGRNNGEI
jgi:hypothetical protein